MNQHIYGAILESQYPLHKHEELRQLLPYSNLPAWRFVRYDEEHPILGLHYIGIEEESIDQLTHDYLVQLGFIIFEDSGSFNAWLIKFQPEGMSWPI